MISRRIHRFSEINKINNPFVYFGREAPNVDSFISVELKNTANFALSSEYLINERANGYSSYTGQTTPTIHTKAI